MTAKASTAPAPSSTRATATEMPTGPITRADGLFDSGRPDSVDTDPAGSVIVTSPFDDGRTPIVQRRFSLLTTRSAERTLPLVTVNALSLSVV